MLKKTIGFFVLFLLSFGISAVCSAAVDYNSIITNESNWIATLQQTSGTSAGSIVTHRQEIQVHGGVNYYRMEPYFANLAVIGMLENPTAANKTVALNWMNWYLNHLNAASGSVPDGSVFRYYINTSTNQEYSTVSEATPANPSATPTPQGYDSTDSYAATFITLAKKYYEVSGDSSVLINNKTKLERIAGAMLATMDTDGLTNAKPDYAIKYLMDNCEVNEGLKDMEWLENNILNDVTKANFYLGKRNLNTTGIELMWNGARGNYDHYWANRVADSLSQWGRFYADAVAQIYPAWTGLTAATDARSISLNNTLNANFPSWQNLSIVNTVPESNGTYLTEAYPWAILAYNAALMHDQTRVDAFITNIQNTYINTNRTSPKYYNLEAGFIIRAAKAMRDYLNPPSTTNLALNKTATASSFGADTPKSVDGNLSTRWGSAYANNEWYKVDLGSTQTINKVIVNWEAAYDTAYSIQTSSDNVNFTTVYSTTTGDGGIDTINITPVTARYVKILLTTRATPYGSSFWEFEVYNNLNTTNYALNKTATASSNAADTPKSVDGNLSTRWGSIYANNEWYKVDLGTVQTVSKVIINWEAAYDTAYSIQTSIDNVNFTTVYSTTTGDGGIDTINFSPVSARYVKILCTTRATPYGSSFWEFEVY